jgi:nucleotide-binding universal stress UspA family protein
MFQKILVVLDRSNFDPQVIQKAFTLTQLSGAKLTLLHIIALQDSTVLLLSELEQKKDWAEIDIMCWSASNKHDCVTAAPTKLVRPKTKLKVAANVATLEPPVLNHLHHASDNVMETYGPSPSPSHRLGDTIVDIAQFCKADLIVMALPQLSDFVPVCYDVLSVTDCPVLIFKVCVNDEE